MRVVIIGSGNVATVFARLIKKGGHTILQIVSRQLCHARILATELHCSAADNFMAIDKTADIYIVAIDDDSLNKLVDFTVENKLIVHTAGAVSKNVLAHISQTFGVLYPLQSLRKEMQEVMDIPLLIDGNSQEAISLIEKFALTISPVVTKADDEKRLKLHVAATVVNNFSNHLFFLTEKYCANENIDFKMLIPIITETAHRLITHSPANLQTGPAIRNDLSTINKHLALLDNHPQLKLLYQTITESIRANH